MKSTLKKKKTVILRLVATLLLCAVLITVQTAFATEPTDDYDLTGLVIGVDPCNQRTEDTNIEPLYPNSDRFVWKITAGTVGIKSETPEYILNLAIANKLAQRLMKSGATVIMSREDNDSNLSNAGRAVLMNTSDVDFWIRISCNSSPDSNVSGAVISFPSRTYCPDIYAKSLELARTMADEMQKLMGTKKTVRVQALANQAAFNYSNTPVINVGVGYLTNPQEDLDLNREAYLNSLTVRICEGVLEFAAAQQD